MINAADLGEYGSHFLSAAGASFATLYVAWRRFKKDGTADAVDEKSQRLIDNLSQRLEREQAQNEHLGTVIDRLATERNDAVQKVGRLEGMVQSMDQEIKRLNKEVVRLGDNEKSLAENVRNIMEEYRELMEINRVLRAQIEKIQ